MSTTAKLFRLTLAASLLALVPAAGARAASASAVSANWAGYAVSARSSTAHKSFSHVAASWVAPAATCTPGAQTYSAFWIGIGGSGARSQALEQTGTEADCNRAGQASYSAWYELVPAAPVNLRGTILPGDRISASVTVRGSLVTVHLVDSTRATAVTKTLRMRGPSPDTSSAEWIAEAPSACDNFGNCQPLALTDFQSVSFSQATATAGGRRGTISDPRWSATKITLQDSGGFRARRFATVATAAQAIPSALSLAGDAFSIAWQQSSTQSQPPVYPGFGGPANRPLAR